MISYPGWLWSYGINYNQREADLGVIYHGGAQALALLHRYRASYIVVGPAERASLSPNTEYFAQNFQLVLHSSNYQIYEVPS
jgi:uncharacterized membrane protein